MSVLLALCGCTPHYFNLNYPDGQQQNHYVIDHGYCTQVSYGAVQMPQIHLNNNTGSSTTSGNVYMSGSNGNYTGRYNSTTNYNGNFISGFADGMNIGSAMAANQSRSDIYASCLARLGWFRIEGTTYLRPSLDFGAELNANSLDLQKSLDELTSKGFITPICNSTGTIYTLLKGDSIRNEETVYYITFAEIYPKDIMLSFPGTSPQGVPVAYKIYDYMIDTSVNRAKVLKIEGYSRNNEKYYTHNDSEMNSITSAYLPTSVPAAYLDLNSQINKTTTTSLTTNQSRFSIAESYARIVNYLAEQGYSDTLFDKATLSQMMINKDSIVKNGDKISYSVAQIFDVDRMSKKSETDNTLVFIAYYKNDYIVDIKSKRLKVVGFKAYNRKNEEVISRIYSDMESTTAEITNTSVADRFLKKYSPEYAEISN